LRWPDHSPIELKHQPFAGESFDRAADGVAIGGAVTATLLTAATTMLPLPWLTVQVCLIGAEGEVLTVTA